jgi:hypothetical protein
MARETMETYTFREKPSKYLKVIKMAKKERVFEAEIIRKAIEQYDGPKK